MQGNYPICQSDRLGLLPSIFCFHLLIHYEWDLISLFIMKCFCRDSSCLSVSTFCNISFAQFQCGRIKSVLLMVLLF